MLRKPEKLPDEEHHRNLSNCEWCPVVRKSLTVMVECSVLDALADSRYLSATAVMCV
jgi:hypothetical protein